MSDELFDIFIDVFTAFIADTFSSKILFAPNAKQLSTLGALYLDKLI